MRAIYVCTCCWQAQHIPSYGHSWVCVLIGNAVGRGMNGLHLFRAPSSCAPARGVCHEVSAVKLWGPPRSRRRFATQPCSISAQTAEAAVSTDVAAPSCSILDNGGALSKQDYGKFVQFFRQASPYIEGHRGRTFVVVIPGEVGGFSLPHLSTCSSWHGHLLRPGTPTHPAAPCHAACRWCCSPACSSPSWQT